MIKNLILKEKNLKNEKIFKILEVSAKWFQDKIKGLKGGLRNKFSTTNPDKFYRESDNKINPNTKNH